MPAWMPSSVNVPSSTSSAIRSRAVSLSGGVLAGDPLLAAAEPAPWRGVRGGPRRAGAGSRLGHRCSCRALYLWEVGSPTPYFGHGRGSGGGGWEVSPLPAERPCARTLAACESTDSSSSRWPSRRSPRRRAPQPSPRKATRSSCAPRRARRTGFYVGPDDDQPGTPADQRRHRPYLLSVRCTAGSTPPSSPANTPQAACGRGRGPRRPARRHDNCRPGCGHARRRCRQRRAARPRVHRDRPTGSSAATATTRSPAAWAPTTIDGGDGDDEIDARGPDVIHGGDGNDKLVADYWQEQSTDVVDGGPGYDQIESNWESEAGKYQPPIVVSIDGVANDGRPGENDNVTAVERIYLNAPATLTGSDGPDEFTVFNTDGRQHVQRPRRRRQALRLRPQRHDRRRRRQRHDRGRLRPRHDHRRPGTRRHQRRHQRRRRATGSSAAPLRQRPRRRARRRGRHRHVRHRRGRRRGRPRRHRGARLRDRAPLERCVAAVATTASTRPRQPRAVVRAAEPGPRRAPRRALVVTGRASGAEPR